MTDDTARQSRALAEFASVTGCSGDKARFFLESSAWDVESAVEHFYEEDGMMPGERTAAVAPSAPVPAGSNATPAGLAGGPAAGPWPSGRAPVAGNQGPIRGFKDLGRGGASGKKPSAGNVRSLSDLAGDPGRDESDSDDEDPLEYYTGGEKSGMMVQDPQGPKGARGVDVQRLFETARSMGAREASPEDYDAMRRGAPSAQGSRGGAFTGTARLLSGEPAQPREVEAAAAAPATPSVVEHVITFWANGFTVGDGPLRTMDDPRNIAFFNSIQRGEYPAELAPTDPSVKVSVHLVKRTEEKYKAPEAPKYVAFSGTGRTTGSASSSASPGTAAAPAKPAASAASRPPPTPCDDSAPKTSIQLRLHDGTRMVAQFNHSQTVGDIRRFIEHSQAGGSPSGFQLTTQFPTRVLTDNAQTIEEAGLLNAVVIQKA